LISRRSCGCGYYFLLDRRMKQIVAIVKPFLAEKILDSLKHAPLEACGVCEVKGYGRQKNYLDEYHGSEYSMAFLPKVEITLWVDDIRADEVLRTIVEAARTGRMGDGKIFVMPSAVAGDWEEKADKGGDVPH
jgi:nitrogen regulatory protein PII